MSAPAIFIDTNYLVALLDPKDELHRVAKDASKRLSRETLLTTDFVLVEYLRLFAKRPMLYREAAVLTVKRLRENAKVSVLPASRELFDHALALYLKYRDKQWDLVDCSSCVVMYKHGIRAALTHDVHFEQMGFTALLRD